MKDSIRYDDFPFLLEIAIIEACDLRYGIVMERRFETRDGSEIAVKKCSHYTKGIRSHRRVRYKVVLDAD